MAKILEHKHLIVRAEVKTPPKDTEYMEAWMSRMVKAIGMVELAAPRAIYSDMVGNRGLTCDVILNTSNSVVHVWDEVDPGIFMLDVYSCGSFSPDTILDLIAEFEPVKVEYMFLDREHGLKLLDHKIIGKDKLSWVRSGIAKLTYLRDSVRTAVLSRFTTNSTRL